MATSVSLNGVSYSVPAVADDNWGTSLSAYLVALSSGVLQKAGGSFTLTADVDFGINYGLKSIYYKSRATASTTGVLRLGNAESVGWRNAANSADKLLKVNSSNLLEFDGAVVLVLALGSADTVLRINGAGTAYEYAKLVNANIDSSAAIAYSKLNLATSIVNADVSGSAAIALSKLATTTASRALVSDGSGVITPATTTATEIGYVNGVTSAIQTQLDAKQLRSTLTTKGDLYVATASNTVTRLGVGADGTVLTANSGAAEGVSWGAALTTTLTQYNTFIGNSSNTATATNTALLGDISGSIASTTVTVTSAAPGVVTWTSHPLTDGSKVYFTNSGGALPTGISASTTYYVTTITADTFKLSSSLANYYAGTFVTTTDTGTGTHTAVAGGLVVAAKAVGNATGPDAATTLTAYSARTQIVVPTANRTYTLPTTGILPGDTFTIVNNSAVSSSDLKITVNSSGANLVRTIWSQTSATFVALQATPTTAAHWLCTTPATSDWTAFTPTTSTQTGTKTAYYRREGDSMHVRYHIAFTGSATGTQTVTLPISAAIDTAKLPTTSSNAGHLGVAGGYVAGTTYKLARITYDSTTTVRVLDQLAANYWSATVPGTWASGDNATWDFIVPISGWTNCKG